MLSKSSQRFLRISAIHHNMAHFISESTVHEYQYSIEHFPETSSLMTSGSGTNYDFSICSRSSHSSLSLKELQTLFPDVIATNMGHFCYMLLSLHFCSANVPNQLYICNLGMKFQFMYNKWCILPSKYMCMKRNHLLHSPACPLHLCYNRL